MKNGEKSFGKLFELVEIIARSRKGVSGKELAESSGIPLSTTFRMLKFMVDNSYLRVQGGFYSLGLSFARLGNIAREQNPLLKIARPILEELSAQTMETIHLAELKNNQIIYIDKVEGDRPIRMGSMIGKLNPIYCTGVGKAICAFLPLAEQERLLKEIEYHPFTATTIISSEALRKELIKIRHQGYAIDNCEHEEGVYCLAAPILSYNDISIAGISISGAEMYIRDDTARLARLITRAARQISNAL